MLCTVLESKNWERTDNVRDPTIQYQLQRFDDKLCLSGD